MAPSVVSLKGRRRDADARSVSRVRSLGPWLVPATLAAALSAHAASRGDEALNDLPYFARSDSPARARQLRRPEPAGRAAVARRDSRRGPGAAVARRRGRVRARRRHAVATRGGSPAPHAARRGRDDPRARPRAAVLRVRERPRCPAARPAALAQRVPRRAARPRHARRRPRRSLRGARDVGAPRPAAAARAVAAGGAAGGDGRRGRGGCPLPSVRPRRRLPHGGVPLDGGGRHAGVAPRPRRVPVGPPPRPGRPGRGRGRRDRARDPAVASPAASRPREPSWPSGSCSTRSGTAGTGSRRSSWRSRWAWP